MPAIGRRWTAGLRRRTRRASAPSATTSSPSRRRCATRPGLRAFATRFPERFHDVGIAEQHAVTSAAGLALAGLHPVVAVYATFLNRAFDQLLMDVALHRLPVTFVLDRAGVTGEDGPSHNGVWDLALLGMVPGLRVAAPRDEPTLRAELREAVGHADGPTAVRFPKTAAAPTDPRPAHPGHGRRVERAGPVGRVDVLIVAVGACADEALQGRRGAVGRALGASGRPAMGPAAGSGTADLAADAGLVVTVEDGLVTGGVGSRLATLLREAGVGTPLCTLGVEQGFLDQGTVAQVKQAAGLDAAGITATISARIAATPS